MKVLDDTGGNILMQQLLAGKWRFLALGLSTKL